MRLFGKKPVKASITEVIRRLAADRPKDCELRAPAPEGAIEAAEVALGRPLPFDLGELLRTSNGLDFFGARFVVHGLHHGAPPPYRFGDIVKQTEWHRQNSGVPASCIVFGQTYTSDLAIACVGGSGVRYFTLGLETDSESDKSDSLADFLTKQIRHCEEGVGV